LVWFNYILNLEEDNKMPIINIKTLKLNQEKKNLIAEKIYETTCNIIKIPDIEIYFNEYDSYYIRGKLYNTENPVITVEIQGPKIEKDTLSELSKSINEIIVTTIGDLSFKINYFAYHFLENDKFAISGKLLSEILEN
jgi:phenylpyruvate tautomerase PptA (4-oxalocrotonate tautomerase family)